MHQTIIDKMTAMRLWGMKRAFGESLQPGTTAYTADELLNYLLQAEWDDRHNRKIERLTKAARFRYTAHVEQLIFQDGRNLDKQLVQRLASGDFIAKAENVLVTGSTGVGKSYLISALGHQACQLGYRVRYCNINRLFTQLKMAKADGSYIPFIRKIEKQDLLILDDFGLQPLDVKKSHYLMDIMEDRHAKKATLVASQLPVSAWHAVIADATIADAILDRLVYHAHRIDLKGESLRKLHPKKM